MMQQSQSQQKLLLEQQIKKKYIQSSRILNLHLIDVDKCKIWMDIVKSRDWSIFKLHKIILNENSINNQEFLQLLSLLPKSLQYLRISNCKITHTSIKNFAEYDMKSLKELYLSKNPIGNIGAKWLVRCQLPVLKQLNNIVGCQISGQGFKSISKGKWPQLSILYYNFLPITSIFQQKHR